MIKSSPSDRKAPKCLNCCFCKEWLLLYSSLYLSQHITPCLVNGRYSSNADSIDAIFFCCCYDEAKISSTISEVRYKYYKNTSSLTMGQSFIYSFIHHSFIQSTNTCCVSPVGLAQVNMLRINQWNSEQTETSPDLRKLRKVSQERLTSSWWSRIAQRRNSGNCIHRRKIQPS